MKRKHLEAILDLAELDVREDVIWDYSPSMRPQPERKCFAFRIDQPFEKAAARLAQFYMALGGYASGLEVQSLLADVDDIVETVDVEGWDMWHLDVFPKYGAGDTYTIFFFPEGRVED